MGKATIDDVANLAGVSIKTVSRVVNKERNVRDNTRERVEKAILTLSYRPNSSARRLAGKRSYLIGLLYDDPSLYENPSSNYIVSVQQGALRVCKAENHDLLIHPCNYKNKKLSSQIVEFIDHSQVDGLILTPPLCDNRSLVAAIKKTGTPVVRIAPGDTRNPRLSVVTNDRDICAKMTEHLASLGHKRIAFIAGNPAHKALQSRHLGYQDGLKNRGLNYLPELVKQGDNSFNSGEILAHELLGSKNPPTAIFACNDDMATGVIRAAHQTGIHIPDQLSIAGFDDIPLAQQTSPSLTSIRQPTRAMAEEALKILMKLLKSEELTNISRMVESELRIRDSTASLQLSAD